MALLDWYSHRNILALHQAHKGLLPPLMNCYGDILPPQHPKLTNTHRWHRPAYRKAAANGTQLSSPHPPGNIIYSLTYCFTHFRNQH